MTKNIKETNGSFSTLPVLMVVADVARLARSAPQTLRACLIASQTVVQAQLVREH